MKLYIGENLKKLREEKKVTQDTLAEYLGVTYQAVSRWENGAAYPDIELLPEIARFFGVSMEELMGCENSEREAERKAIMIANQRWDPNIDRKELLRELHELERQYPNNWEIKERICSVLVEPKPDSYDEVLPELRRYACAAMEKFPPDKDRMFEWFCRNMIFAAPEDEVEEWASYMKIYDLNNRWNLMKIRYQEREDWEKARHYQCLQIQQFLYDISCIGPIPETMADLPKSQLYTEQLRERVYDAVIGTPYRDEDGTVHNSIELFRRTCLHFDMAWDHIGSWGYRGTVREADEGFAVLEKAVGLALLYADAVKHENFVSDNPYLEPQKVGEQRWFMNDAEFEYLREHSLDFAISQLTGQTLAEALQEDERLHVLLQRLYDKKAELEEYWRTRD